jgi:hypothetical protein
VSGPDEISKDAVDAIVLAIISPLAILILALLLGLGDP